MGVENSQADRGSFEKASRLETISLMNIVII
jgi:hypothetical protein